MRRYLVIMWSLIFLLSFSLLESKVLIITHSYNRPDFIEIQHKTFQHFLKDDYEFVVFNDAVEKPIKEKIYTICKKLGIRCVRIPQQIHAKPYLYRHPGEDYQHPCARCANVIQYSLDTLGFSHDDIVVIFDSDMFLIQEISFRNLLGSNYIVAVPQLRNHVHYIWNGLVIFNMTLLPDTSSLNFNSGVIEGQPCDVGGYTYYYFKNHPEVTIRRTRPIHISSINLENDLMNLRPEIISYLQKKPDNVEFFLDFSILHYRGGGNWNYRSAEYHRTKTDMLNELIDNILENDAGFKK